jgi:hypothetical protein
MEKNMIDVPRITKRLSILTATYMLEPGLYLTEQMLAFMSMLITLDSCCVHHTLTCLQLER